MFIWFYIIHLLQIDVDIGSSTVANGVLGLVVGVITTLVVDMAFLVQVRFFFYLQYLLNFNLARGDCRLKSYI